MKLATAAAVLSALAACEINFRSQVGDAGAVSAEHYDGVDVVVDLANRLRKASRASP